MVCYGHHVISISYIYSKFKVSIRESFILVLASSVRSLIKVMLEIKHLLFRHPHAHGKETRVCLHLHSKSKTGQGKQYSWKTAANCFLMYVLDFYFLEDPPENHLWVIGGLLVKY